MYKVYKLNTNMTKEFIDDVESSMDISEIEFLENLGNDEPVVDFMEEGFNACYIICTEYIVEKVKSIFSKYGGTVKDTDITKEFFYGIIKIDNAMFEQYIYDNMTKDMVLDKILELGKESLTDLDKEILSL